MRAYYAILDTNVLVSAMLKEGSVPYEVLAEALEGDIIPVLNDEIIAEYTEVLNRSKFKFSREAVDVLLEELKSRGIYYSQDELIDYFIPDPKDVVFYAVLMDARKNKDAYLVTGNLKHFPARTYIVTPREMLDIVRGCVGIIDWDEFVSQDKEDIRDGMSPEDYIRSLRNFDR